MRNWRRAPTISDLEFKEKIDDRQLTIRHGLEGHVPAADIERLLAERPAGVTGLAVAGMPMGSPGMEHGDHRQAYQVIAFGPEGRSVWANYPANHGSAS